MTLRSHAWLSGLLPAVVGSQLAYAQPETDVFRWDAPSGECPSEAAVLDGLEQKLDVSLADLREREVFFIARIRSGEGARWELRLYYLTKAGRRERTIEDDDCQALAEQAMLLAALAIEAPVDRLTETPVDVPVDNTIDMPVDVPADNTIDVPADRTSSTIAIDTPPEARRKHAPPLRTSLPISLGTTLGEVAPVAPALRLGVDLGWGRGRLSLAAHYAAAVVPLVVGGEQVHLHDALLLARGCYVARPHVRLELPLCAGAEAGVMFDGGGAVSPAGWFALDIAAGLSWVPRPRFALGLIVEPWVTPRSTELVDQKREQVHWQAEQVGMRVMVGGEVRIR